MNRWTALSIAAVLVAVLLWWWLPPREPESPPAPEPEPARIVRDVVAVEPAPRPAPRPSPDVAPGGYAEAHATVGEAMGYVATRCYVGSEFDSDDLVGRFHQTIADGWYSHVETTLEGRRLVEKRVEREDVPEDAPLPDRVDFEGLFWVSWHATEPGQAVTCSVELPSYATLDVTVVDPEGYPMDGVEVYACRVEGVTRDGRVRLDDVWAAYDCSLMASCDDPDRQCNARVDIPPLAPGEVRAVTVEADVYYEGDGRNAFLAYHERRVPYERPEPSPLELSRDEELEHLLALAEQDLPDRTAELVGDLIDHREWVDGRAREREELSDEIEVLEEKMVTAPGDEGVRLSEEVDALYEELFDLR